MNARVLSHWSMAVALVALTAIGVACSGSDEASPVPTQPAGPSADVLAGEELYISSCGWCHGFDMRGTERGPSHLAAVYEPSRLDDAAIRAAIQHGVDQQHWQFGPMPAVAGFSEEEIDQIIAFMRYTQAAEGFES